MVVLEGYPLYFKIVNKTTGARVGFLGRESKLALSNSDFTTLQPNGTLTVTVNLVRDPLTNVPRYKLLNSGTFDVTTIYEQFRNVAEAVSNTLTITLQAGGGLTGKVSNATNATPISGARVEALQGTNVITSVTTDTAGNYTIPELPPGLYTFEASANGFLRNRQGNVQITAGQTTTVNFSLSPLLAAGEIRLVLTWGSAPNDLDSYLWLPADRPYKIYYGNRGNFTACPFATLDVDDTSAFGPETITIAQRYLTGQYTYAIHNYSSSPDIATSQAKVQVFDSSGLIATINIPTTQVAGNRWWKVLTIDGPTGSITEVNQIMTDATPYTASSTGCTIP